MSNEYIAAAVVVLVSILPRFGVQVGSEELTAWIQAGVAVVSGILIMVRRYKRGDINIAGVRKM